MKLIQRGAYTSNISSWIEYVASRGDEINHQSSRNSINILEVLLEGDQND